jgi:hypothetical protein
VQRHDHLGGRARSRASRTGPGQDDGGDRGRDDDRGEASQGARIVAAAGVAEGSVRGPETGPGAEPVAETVDPVVERPTLCRDLALAPDDHVVREPVVDLLVQAPPHGGELTLLVNELLQLGGETADIGVGLVRHGGGFRPRGDESSSGRS